MASDQHTTDSLAASTFVVGAQLFEGVVSQMSLAFIFCFAVRSALLDEIEGVDQTPEEAFESVWESVQPPMPPAAANAFRAMMFNDFERWIGHLRAMAVKEQVDFAEYAEALKDDNLRATLERWKSAK